MLEKRMRAAKLSVPRYPPPNKLFHCSGSEGVLIRTPDQLQSVLGGNPLAITFVFPFFIVTLRKTG